jgi:hypothetical protein
MWEHIVTEHKAELIKKDKPSMSNTITTNARGNVTDHSNQESQENIMTGHKAELFAEDQLSMGNIITTYAKKDVNKEKVHDVMMKNDTEELF